MENEPKRTENRVVEDKLYRVIRKVDSHVNIKINEDGSKSAIQFTNDTNDLTGPLDIVEVDESEYVRTEYIETTPPPRTFGQIVLEDVVAPVLAEAVHQGLEIGSIYFQRWLDEKAIPKAKKKTKELKANAKILMAGVKDGLAGKKTTVVASSKTSSIKQVEPPIEEAIYDKEIRSPEEIQNIINMMKASAVTLAACIKMLKNSVMADDGTDPEKILEFQKNLDELTTADVMNQINLLLEEKNRDLLDQVSLRMLAAFREGYFMVGDEKVAISNYLSVNE